MRTPPQPPLKADAFLGTFFSRGPGEREAIRPGARREAPLSPPAQLVPEPCCREQGPRSGGGAGKPCCGGNGRTHGTRILLPSDWLCGAMGRMLQALGPGAREVTLRLTCARLSFCVRTCLIGWVRGAGSLQLLGNCRAPPLTCALLSTLRPEFCCRCCRSSSQRLSWQKTYAEAVRLASGPGLKSIMA